MPPHSPSINSNGYGHNLDVLFQNQDTLLDHLSDGIIITDRDFRIKRWNKAAERYFGKNAASFTGKYYRDLFTVEGKLLSADEIRALLLEGNAWKGELCISTHDQTPIYVQATINPLFDDAGNHIGYISVGHDISNEKAAFEELLLKQKQFISFMEHSPSLAWINDEEGILLYMNTLFQQSFALPDTVLGQNIYDYYPPEMRQACRQSDQEVLQLNDRITIQEKGVDAIGRPIYYQVYKFPIETSTGKRLIGGMAIDITEQKEISNALYKSNELYENAGKATRDVIWDWDLRENTIRRIGGFKILFGHDQGEELIEFDVTNIHPEDAEAVRQSWQTALDGDSTRWVHEFRYRCADGSYKIVQDQASIIRDEQGKAIRMIGSMQDINEERKLQQQILDNEIRKKREVVAAVINAQEKERREISDELHDNVNQLLAATILFLKTAQKQEQNTGELIKQGLDYLHKAIDEIRNISHSLNPDALSVNGLVAVLRDMAHRLTIPGSFSLEIHIADEFDEHLISAADKLTLYRIIQEKISNILRHAGATEVHIHIGREGAEWVIRVSDNGVGFDVEQVSKGLGLVNIHTRAESIGGKAFIQSSPGKGCVISIRLPVQPISE
jgi:PAS domain S-box-containing protein